MEEDCEDESQLVETPEISLHAINGVRIAETMQIQGSLRQVAVYALIDSRSTHNLVSAKLAKKEFWNLDSKLSEEITKLVELGCCGSDCTIFCLRGGPCYCVLLFGAPADGSGSKKNDVSCGGSLVIWITCPIRVSKGRKLRWRCASDK
ncbi:hypothetical protein LWI29_015860 [Acer saccharum]|uniref:Uncharacterized protein n=1 Tax=Acer saccharum TaxID=4024 RepID=A0AA39VIH4_ACESA|nr:hypothetical protein LWI29_015860 [Acer saccharum]